jgi:hypothetical protein
LSRHTIACSAEELDSSRSFTGLWRQARRSQTPFADVARCASARAADVDVDADADADADNYNPA